MTSPHQPGPSRTPLRRLVDGATRRAAVVALTTAVAVAIAPIAVAPPAAAAPAVPRPPVAFTTPPEAPARYVGQVSCDPVERPGTVGLKALLQSTYGYANSGGLVRDCSVGGKSEHKDGRAYDWMRDVSRPAEKEMADAFVAWLTGTDAQGVAAGNAHRLGVQYVIWNKRTWASYTGAWKTYTGANPHTDHVHISLSWDGAMQRTSWWTGRAISGTDYGPCQLFVGEPAPRYTTRRTTPCPAPVPRADGVLSGDWDGDGDDELGTFVDGAFALEVQGRTQRFTYGRAGDVPVAGDFDGDGDDEIGVFRAGAWHLRNAAGPGAAWRSFQYGRAGDRPVTGTWRAGAPGVGVVRGNTWYLRDGLASGPSTTLSWGRSTDAVMSGDWDGDGLDQIGVRRANTWFLMGASRSDVTTTAFGAATDVPVPGDWDGNDTETVGVARLGTAYLRDDLRGGAPTTTTDIPF